MIAGAVVILALGLSVLEAAVQLVDQGGAAQALGRRTQSAYLDVNLGWFSPAMQAVNQLPAELRVLMLFEARSLYCLPPAPRMRRWIAGLGERHDGADAEAGEEILPALAARGVHSPAVPPSRSRIRS